LHSTPVFPAVGSDSTRHLAVADLIARRELLLSKSLCPGERDVFLPSRWLEQQM
jgi:hypothetical protein